MVKAHQETHYERWALTLIGFILAVRVIGVFITPLNLGPDEAQYWRWGQSVDWGYYSKPPLIAWLIGGVTGIFGNGEWAVRLPAPFLQAGAAGILFLLARDMFSPRTAFFAALTYILMPGVTLSSGLMTTDGVLLPLWSLGLVCFWRLGQRPQSWAYASGLGLAIGLGFLAKYAMIYFLIGMGLAALFNKASRAALFSPRGALAGAIAMSVLAGHILWSRANGFETVAHTVDNANWGGPLFNLENGLTFLADQMGVAGPIGFLVLLAALIALLYKRPGRAKRAEMWLACFICPALVIILVQAITSRAHANWAATAYAGGSVLIAAWCTGPHIWKQRNWAIAAGLVFCAALAIPDMGLVGRFGIGTGLAGTVLGFGYVSAWGGMGLMKANLGLHAVFAAVFIALAIGPVAASDALGLGQSFKRTRGWQESTQQIAALAARHNVSAVLVDERENWHGLDYYGHGGVLPLPIYTWHRNPSPKSYAETFRLAEGDNRPVLIAAKSKFLNNRIDQDFDTVKRFGFIDIKIGKGANRRFHIYVAQGFHPVERTADWQRLNPEDF